MLELLRRFAEKVDERVATEGHPYKNATRIIGVWIVCRGGPPWPPHASSFTLPLVL